MSESFTNVFSKQDSRLPRLQNKCHHYGHLKFLGNFQVFFLSFFFFFVVAFGFFFFLLLDKVWVAPVLYIVLNLLWSFAYWFCQLYFVNNLEMQMKCSLLFLFILLLLLLLLLLILLMSFLRITIANKTQHKNFRTIFKILNRRSSRRKSKEKVSSDRVWWLRVKKDI